MSDWVERTLGDLIDLQRGHDLPSQDRRAGLVPIIGSFGITGSHDVSKYAGPGVAIGRSGAAIGTATFVGDDYWPLNTCLFVSDFKGNDPQWIYRLLDTIDFMAFNSGSAQPSLNRNFLRNIPVMVPSITEQRAIAEVLGAVDDKIAANTKLASTANALAVTLFHDALRSGSLSGQVFSDLASISGGGTPSTKVSAYWDGAVNWATPTDVTALSGPYLESTSRTISDAGLASCSSKLFEPGAILMTSRATIGAFAIAQVPTAVNQGFIVVEPNDPSLRYWLFHEMRSRVDEFVAMANGATFLELSKGNFKKFQVRLANPHIMTEFNQEAEALHASARHALLENCALTVTRDALLPQLMSGKLRVKEAEMLVEELV